jgi:hypothetical protein
MAYTTIDDPSAYFQISTWTGDGEGSRSFTFDGNSNLQPDWVWIKSRSTAQDHALYDSVRGVQKSIASNNTNAEVNQNVHGYITAFNTNGFSVANGSSGNGDVNYSSRTYVAWNWLAGGSASSNSNGSITSNVSANTTAGFSIVSYTGTGSNATVGHGLGVAPKMFIVKNRSTATNWHVYHHKNTSAPETDYLLLNTNNATADNSIVWNDTAPTSSVFSIGTTDGTNKNTSNMIAYCFAEKKGYSKFGSYTGNGDADGTFVYTGFKPSWVLVKRTDGTQDWFIIDNKRNTFNVSDTALLPNASDADYTSTNIYGKDVLSNGFKVRGSSSRQNGSGNNYIYMAFAESPFVNSNGVPTNAR